MAASTNTSKQVATTQVAVTSAASVTVLAANPRRKRALIKNIGATNFAWVRVGNSVVAASSTNGYKLALDAVLEIWDTGAVTARADSADVTFTVIEEYD